MILAVFFVFKNSKAAGIREITTIAKMTREKFLRTKGRLPKKNPLKVPTSTHSTPPTVL